MRWIGLTVVVLSLIGLYGLGAWLGKKAPKLAMVWGGAAVLSLLGIVFFNYYPNVEFALFPYRIYGLVRPCRVFLPAFAILGVGASLLGKLRNRRALAAFAVLLVVVGGHRFLITRVLPYRTLTGEVDAEGSCRQTSPWSCGPAAAAMLLDRLGVESDENEMAVLANTNSLAGTDAHSLALGLRKKLAGKGYHVDLVRREWDDLADSDVPVLAELKSGFLLHHWVAVLEVTERDVLLGDPGAGRIRVPKEEFLDDWRHIVITTR